MITHLISTTEFVKLIHEKYLKGDIQHIQEERDLIVNYVNFISQKPTKENCKLYFTNCEHTSFDKINDKDDEDDDDDDQEDEKDDD